MRAMLDTGFQLDADSFSKYHVEDEQHFKNFKKGVKGLKIAANIAGVILNIDIPNLALAFELNPVFESQSFRQDMMKIYPLTNTVFYKFVMSQPVIVPIIDGDDYTRDSVEHIQMVEVAEGIHLRVNEDLMTADYPVNLAVLKTHTQIKVNLGL